jgi:hypothetical protein
VCDIALVNLTLRETAPGCDLTSAIAPTAERRWLSDSDC